MDMMQAIRERHSVRSYTTAKIEPEKRERLQAVIDACNTEGGLNLFIRYDDPEGFDSRMAHYGNFRNVANYIVLAGPKDRDIDEACGYYGERVVLEAQMLGLNTCWVALTFNRKMVQKLIPADQKLCMVIALGYGENQGSAHKGKSLDQVVVSKGTMPDWFRKGAEAALLAPTAVNQQKFEMGVKDGEPVIRVSGHGAYTKTDLGIVKYHFEAASGRKVK